MLWSVCETAWYEGLEAVRVGPRVDSLLAGRLHDVDDGLLLVGEEGLELGELLGAQVEGLEEGAVGLAEAALHLDRHQLLELGIGAHRRKGGKAPSGPWGRRPGRPPAGVPAMSSRPAAPHRREAVLEALDRVPGLGQLAFQRSTFGISKLCTKDHQVPVLAPRQGPRATSAAEDADEEV